MASSVAGAVLVGAGFQDRIQARCVTAVGDGRCHKERA